MLLNHMGKKNPPFLKKLYALYDAKTQPTSHQIRIYICKDNLTICFSMAIWLETRLKRTINIYKGNLNF